MGFGLSHVYLNDTPAARDAMLRYRRVATNAYAVEIERVPLIVIRTAPPQLNPGYYNDQLIPRLVVDPQQIQQALDLTDDEERMLVSPSFLNELQDLADQVRNDVVYYESCSFGSRRFAFAWVVGQEPQVLWEDYHPLSPPQISLFDRRGKLSLVPGEVWDLASPRLLHCEVISDRAVLSREFAWPNCRLTL